jgi:hypothetical protein
MANAYWSDKRTGLTPGDDTPVDLPRRTLLRSVCKEMTDSCAILHALFDVIFEE